MKTLFLVDGAAGTGKSDLLRYLATKKKRVAIAIRKYTTRRMREEEESRQLPLDLRFPPDSHEQFTKRMSNPEFYWYPYGNRDYGENFYGFYRRDIEEALESRDVALVIVRDRETINQIQRDFPSVKCVSVFVYTDRDQVLARLREEGLHRRSH